MSRTRHTAKEKARILREFEHHAGSAASFCRQRDVSYQTLMNWRRQVSTKLQTTEQPPAFLEFQLIQQDRQISARFLRPALPFRGSPSAP